MTTEDSIAVSNRSEEASAGARLCQQIDQFATEVLLADESAPASGTAIREFAAALSRIGESAGQLGCANTSQIAASLAKETQPGRDAAALLAYLSEGIQGYRKPQQPS